MVDGGNARVQIFDGAGRYVDVYGRYGTGDGQFLMPRDIVVDAYGRCYVVDVGRGEILVFERSGAESAGTFRPELPGGGAGDAAARLARRPGRAGRDRSPDPRLIRA